MFLAVAEALAERGWRVELLAAGPEPALRAAVRPPVRRVDIGPRGLRGLPSPRLLRLALGVRRLSRWIEERRPARQVPTRDDCPNTPIMMKSVTISGL